MNVLGCELEKRYPELSPMEFYRRIFPEGALDAAGAFTPGKYVGIAVRIVPPDAEGRRTERYSITDDLEGIKPLLECEDFCIMSPIAYAGRRRVSKNARVMYALVVELDDLVVEGAEQVGLHRLEQQWTERVGWIPKPTYVVASGNGLHLYYQFAEPLQLWPQVVESLRLYKEKLTVRVWNSHTTNSYRPEQIQHESVFQGFRMVGTATKAGDKTRAFLVGEPVELAYLNTFLLPDEVKKYSIRTAFKRSHKLEEAREKWPEWYERRVVRGQPRGSWTCKPDLYEWWKRRIRDGAVVGHRYYCLMMLSVYAVKCGISQEQLERDAFELMDFLESKTDNPKNHFTEKDVMAALQAFEDGNVVRYSINAISGRAGIPIERNKRNGRRQEIHLKIARASKQILKEAGELERDGRPSSEMRVKRWRLLHPEGTKTQCKVETGMSYTTIAKWWNE